ESDWMFLYLLLWVAVTGVAQNVLHRFGADEAANVMYVIHLMGVVPMLVLEVPFGKWAHLAYRPLAVYFAKVQQHAEAAAVEKAKAAAEAA
ncbi:MAG TPA: 4Fe-4S ferredoxin, partial [Thermoleophilia bacterium]|nr:4Fe-4S ferredoxin [Thermoleophilia bacterium]